MIEKHDDELGHKILLVSRTGIIGFIVFSLTMTFLLMALFMLLDFDSILGRKNLAMKVGQTSISLGDFHMIKEISGEMAKKMPDQTFAQELFETLILAEDARNQSLDQTEEFRQKIQFFDAALKGSEDEERISRSIFLIEELAKASIENLMKNNAVLLEKTLRTAKLASKTPELKLHVKTIKVNAKSDLMKIESDIASGSTFEQINASYSTSLYKAVGGDLGWKTRQDFPEGVFEKLANASTGVLIEGFTDAAGIHLFQVEGRHLVETTINPQSSSETSLRDLKNRLVLKHIIDLRALIDYWINPSLQASCQIVTDNSADKGDYNH